jgi:hypothetical protein
MKEVNRLKVVQAYMDGTATIERAAAALRRRPGRTARFDAGRHRHGHGKVMFIRGVARRAPRR